MSRISQPHQNCLVIGLLLLSLSEAGCSYDPNVRKQKFLAQGNQAFQKGEFSAAAIFYERAIQTDPQFAEAHFHLAQTHMKMNSWMAAYQEFRRTVELSPENWQAHLSLGQLELAGGRRKEAKDRAQLILHSEERDADAKMLLANADLALGNRKNAVQEASEAVSLAPDRPALYLNLGRIQYRDGKLSDAESNFQKAQSLEPKSLVPYMTLGGFYQAQKRWPEAEKQYQAAIEVAPRDSTPRAALARLYFAQGQISQAEQVLTVAKEHLRDDPNAYRLLGDSFIGRGLNAMALPEFASLAAEYPDDLSARKTYVQLLILSNRIDEANQQNQELFKKSPLDPEVLVLKGQIELRQKQTDQAITTFLQALKNAPDDALGHYHLGAAYKQKGNTQQAEAEWREAVRLRPALAEAWVALGTNATFRSEWRDLDEISNQLRKSAPNSVDAYLFHATARINQHDVAGAEADLTHLLQLVPDHSMPYIKLGQLRVSQKRFNEAAALFRQALSRDPTSVEAVKGLAEIDLAKNRPADALKCLQEQISHNPNSSAMYQVQGEIQLQSKLADLAEASFSRAVDLDHTNVAALLQLAETQFSLGKAEQAEANYQKAIDLSPRDSRLLLGLGSLYEKSEDWQRARDSYQKALAIDPDSALAANNLAYLLLEHNGDVSVALSLAQTARRGLPNLPNSADTLGWAYYNNRAYSVAVHLFEDAVKAAPNNQVYRYHLALTYKKLNDSLRSKSEFQKAIALNPKSPLAERARRALSETAGS